MIVSFVLVWRSKNSDLIGQMMIVNKTFFSNDALFEHIKSQKYHSNLNLIFMMIVNWVARKNTNISQLDHQGFTTHQPSKFVRRWKLKPVEAPAKATEMTEPSARPLDSATKPPIGNYPLRWWLSKGNPPPKMPENRAWWSSCNINFIILYPRKHRLIDLEDNVWRSGWLIRSNRFNTC